MSAQYRPLPQMPAYNMPPQGYPDPMQDIFMDPGQMYAPSRDLIKEYGSIIKDLTDTDKLMEAFELRLRAKVKDENGKIVEDKNGIAYVKTDKAAREFVDFMRSVVNRHTDFSYYDSKDSEAIVKGFAQEMAWWLAARGKDIPLHYRGKILIEAGAYMFASLRKAENGTMLKWSKGAISESSAFNQRPEKPKGMLDYLMPWRKPKQEAY